LSEVAAQTEQARRESKDLREQLEEIGRNRDAEMTAWRDKLSMVQKRFESMTQENKNLSTQLEERDRRLEKLEEELETSRRHPESGIQKTE
jgi:predicted RNase H-like nuclease (RuvC/YqgF family)